MTTSERVLGSLLGAAIGDTYEERARTVGTLGSFFARRSTPPCTAATEHVVLAALALTDALRRGTDPNGIGEAMGRELVRWSQDANMTHRRASAGSIEAAARLDAGDHWASVGAREEAIEPLLRAVVVGLAFPTDEVMMPAVVATAITHTHPDMLQAAVMTAYLISATARGRRLELRLVAEAASKGLQAAPEGRVVTSVLATLERGRGAARGIDDVYALLSDWQDSRTGRAVALAFTAATLCAEDASPHSLEQVLKAIARHPEAPAGFGALTGALLGAVWGDAMLPTDASDAVQHGQTLEALAGVLHLRARGVAADFGHPEAAVHGPPMGIAANLFQAAPVEDATDFEWVMLEAMEAALEDRAPGGIERTPVPLANRPRPHLAVVGAQAERQVVNR